MPEMNVVNNDKFVVPRSTSASPPPPSLPLRPPRPNSPLDPPGPAVAAACRPFRRSVAAAGDTAFPFAEADDENDLPPSYEISTLPRPSDAHIHVTVRSNASASSLPSLMAGRVGGRGSINTQGYLLTAPMSHTTTASASSHNTSAYYNPRGAHHRRPSSRWDQWDHWDRTHHNVDSSGSGGCCRFRSNSDNDECFFSRRGGCFFSDRDGCCFSDRGGCCFSDREGCCCSDEGGCCFSSSEGACCSDGPGCCCSRFEDERLPVMENNVRFA